jgi:hypothetical protein
MGRHGGHPSLKMRPVPLLPLPLLPHGFDSAPTLKLKDGLKTVAAGRGYDKLR